MKKLSEEELENQEIEFKEKFEQWKPLIMKTCKEIMVDDRSLDYEDVIGSLKLILLKSMRGFDPSKKNKFITYLTRSLINEKIKYKTRRINRTNYTKDEMIHVAFIEQRGKMIPLYDKDPVLANIPLSVARFQAQGDDQKDLTDDEVLDYYNFKQGIESPLRKLLDGELLNNLNEDEREIAEGFIHKKRQAYIKDKKRGIGKERYDKALNSLKKKVMEYFSERFTEEEREKCGIV